MFLAGVSACGHKGKSKENDEASLTYGIDAAIATTAVKFVSMEHDFGQVKEGEKVTHVFELLNTGKADLLIQSVNPSCGCTAPKYDKKPIRPGRKGTIEVAFDTKGRPGKQHKTVTVITNTEPNSTILSFFCEVIPSEKANSLN